MDTELRLAGVIKESIVDGPGIRYVVFAQGCPHHCEGCHNPDTHPFEGGFSVAPVKIIEDIKKNKLISGITLSGGEPFCQASAFSVLAEMAKDNGLTVIAYTGYTFEHLLSTKDPAVFNLLQHTDRLIDGPFILAQKSLSLKFRGSKNQRVIDVNASLQGGNIIETEI
ncbi:MAG: anaerobic ribonucleoside-triphosphate reductase activating protein [Clostridiales bacterium 43-6]|nr:MAG: anaerobic ribonucleoside-triphosphate reductase activating protein [Clostridiales bacterium 43-6]